MYLVVLLLSDVAAHAAVEGLPIEMVQNVAEGGVDPSLNVTFVPGGGVLLAIWNWLLAPTEHVEPGIFFLLGVGMLALAFTRRRRSRPQRGRGFP